MSAASPPANASLDGSDVAGGPPTLVRRARVSLVWVVPLAALLVVAYLVYESVARRGPLVEIRFQTGAGIVPSQTEVRHKAVPLGVVEDVELADDLKQVKVYVRMNAGAKRFMTDHARFWVVRARLTPAAITGLETLVSGSYIEVDPGVPGGRRQTTFTGLEEPPGVKSDEAGRVIELKAARIGALSEGSSVFFRDVKVGELLKYDLGDGKGPVTLRAFLRAPYDQWVHPGSLFWNASGASLSMGAEGLHLEMQSVQALLGGAIAFENPPGADDQALPENPPPFELHEDRAKAEAHAYARSIPCATYFRTSVQGLEPGSAVEMFGVELGVVTELHLAPATDGRGFMVRVAFDLQPARAFHPDRVDLLSRGSVEDFVGQGLRVVLESSNFVTGQKVLSLEYTPGARPAEVVSEGDVLVLPGRSGGLEGITTALADVANKLAKIPFEEIGRNVDLTLRSVQKAVGGPELQNAIASLSATMHDAQHLAHEADTDLTPALKRLPAIGQALEEAVARANAAVGESGYGQNSDLQRGLQRMIEQVTESARTIRLLADFLNHHPETLLRGRSLPEGQTR